MSHKQTTDFEKECMIGIWKGLSNSSTAVLMEHDSITVVERGYTGLKKNLMIRKSFSALRNGKTLGTIDIAAL